MGCRAQSRGWLMEVIMGWVHSKDGCPGDRGCMGICALCRDPFCRR